MNRKVLFFIVFIICLSGFSLWAFSRGNAQLVTDKSSSKRAGDFILHVRVERADKGIKVYRSIQYVGKEPIEIQHNTPLIAVSLAYKNHDYTGSPVTKVLKEGGSYHPQDAAIIKQTKKGSYNLYCKAKFTVEGEKVVIDHTEKLIFE
ncbi:hypothetical protein [Virgibacillus dakarensis]|uniref:hypothetical protein n=1 Tax=Virgibacillus dakarensis TaxID=1917889 RepID=UPI000B44C5C4|nr:hypothetical protein [Virgibacillus dakarensis]